MKCNRIECYYEIKLDVDLAMGTPEKGEFQNSIKFVQVEALFSLILTKMDCLFFWQIDISRYCQHGYCYNENHGKYYDHFIRRLRQSDNVWYKYIYKSVGIIMYYICDLIWCTKVLSIERNELL